MGKVPTKIQREALEAIARLEKGSWEVISPQDVEDCIKKGWVQIAGNRYRLTEAGREALRRRARDAAASLSSLTQERTGFPA
jgi:hypothetical protein